MTPHLATVSAGCILVVEDDVDARETLCEIVEMAGCSAVGAANGREALDALADWRPCLVILDLTMPVMSGQELLERMKLRPELANVPVVISTSAPHQAPVGWPVIPKPIDIAKVVEWMQRTCHCSPTTAPA
jgi:CheY-like chemotaxis protein